MDRGRNGGHRDIGSPSTSKIVTPPSGRNRTAPVSMRRTEASGSSADNSGMSSRRPMRRPSASTVASTNLPVFASAANESACRVEDGQEDQPRPSADASSRATPPRRNMRRRHRGESARSALAATPFRRLARAMRVRARDAGDGQSSAAISSRRRKSWRRMQRNDPCGEPRRRCDQRCDQRSHLAERVQARIGSETVLEALDGDIHRGGSR